jgi:hypothetical protein
MEIQSDKDNYRRPRNFKLISIRVSLARNPMPFVPFSPLLAINIGTVTDFGWVYPATTCLSSIDVSWFSVAEEVSRPRLLQEELHAGHVQQSMAGDKRDVAILLVEALGCPPAFGFC